MHHVTQYIKPNINDDIISEHIIHVDLSSPLKCDGNSITTFHYNFVEKDLNFIIKINKIDYEHECTF